MAVTMEQAGALAAELLTAELAARPGQPVTMEGGVVPLTRPRRTKRPYATYEQLYESVKAAGKHVYRDAQGQFRPALYQRADGDWVRVTRGHTGEVRHEERGGRVVALAAVKYYERPVALTLEEARDPAWPADYWDAGMQTWIRDGVKREAEHPENMGAAATQAVAWEEVTWASPSPDLELAEDEVPSAVAPAPSRGRRARAEEALDAAAVAGEE